MEYVYAAMLLHKAGKEVNEDSVKKVLEAAGVAADAARIKALVAALEGVNIDEAIEKAAVAAAPVAAAPAGGDAPAAEAKKEEKKKEDEGKANEQAAAGLGALFG
ncbi:50S ribosomal protein P1 [Nanoarchaeota archaeon]